MKDRWHLVLAVGLITFALFNFGNMFMYGNRSCYLPTFSCILSSGFEFLSFATLSSLLAIIEVVTLLLRIITRKHMVGVLVESPPPVRGDRHALGRALELVGFVLMVYGYHGLSTVNVPFCAAGGCSSAVLWQLYGMFDLCFYFGQILIAFGAATVLSDDAKNYWGSRQKLLTTGFGRE